MAQTTSSTTMPDWAQPYAAGYLNRAQQTADRAYQGFSGDRVAGFNPWQQQSLQAQAARATQGNPLLPAAQQALQQQFEGQQPGATANPYLGEGNPYLTQSIGDAQGDMVRAWNTVQAPAFDTAMSRSGSFGNANVAQAAGFGADTLQRNLGRVSTDMRLADLSQRRQLGESFASRQDAMTNSGRGRILQALGMAPDMAQADYADIDRLGRAGAAAQQQEQRLLDDEYSRFTEERDYPLRQLDVMGGALRSVNPGSTTTTNSPDPSRTSQVVGGALTAAQLWALLMGGN